MMEHLDDRLVAYLDGELEIADRRAIEAHLAADPNAAARMAALARSDYLLRQAFDEVMREPVPGRLVAAALGETGMAGRPIVRFVHGGADKPAPSRRGWRIALPIAASLVGLLVGGTSVYLGLVGGGGVGGVERTTEAATANDVWLDSAAGYFKLFLNAGDHALVDLPASGDPREVLQRIGQSLPQAVRLPDLKPWGLTFRGARLVLVGGRPAAQLIYTTDNKAIGPLTLIIGSSRRPDIPPTFDRRQDVNLLYWRHQGRAYALVGQADVGYLWGIGNDVAWQLDAI
jgi:anti-sigma factor RsiW